ncbi:hypothetical protein FGB62_114g09 [Gracilaria domingensis]|nr:hypothetical protein FGB62_114g09 [Gracilaria domingensis]
MTVRDGDIPDAKDANRGALEPNDGIVVDKIEAQNVSKESPMLDGCDKNSPCPDRMKSIATKLARAKCGSLVTLHTDEGTQDHVFYIRTPSTPSLAYVYPGVIIRNDSSLL